MITKFKHFFMANNIRYLIPHAECDAARPWQLMFQDPATPVMPKVLWISIMT